jgi:hypothetical protein
MVSMDRIGRAAAMQACLADRTTIENLSVKRPKHIESDYLDRRLCRPAEHTLKTTKIFSAHNDWSDLSGWSWIQRCWRNQDREYCQCFFCFGLGLGVGKWGWCWLAWWARGKLVFWRSIVRGSYVDRMWIVVCGAIPLYHLQLQILELREIVGLLIFRVPSTNRLPFSSKYEILCLTLLLLPLFRIIKYFGYFNVNYIYTHTEMSETTHWNAFRNS